MGGTAPSSYTFTITAELLSRKKFGKNNTDYALLARYKDKRMITSEEIDDKMVLDGRMIKTLAGSQSILARELFKNPKEIKQNAIVFTQSNNKPVINEKDHGTLRRIIMVEFKHKFSTGRTFGSVVNELQEERNGIFNWMTAGLKDFQGNGLYISKSIAETTENTQLESDVLLDFISDQYDFADGVKEVKYKDIWKEYISWCKENSVKQDFDTKQKFGKALESNSNLRNKGVRKIHGNGRVLYIIGISLKKQELSRNLPECLHNN